MRIRNNTLKVTETKFLTCRRDITFRTYQSKSLSSLCYNIQLNQQNDGMAYFKQNFQDIVAEYTPFREY